MRWVWKCWLGVGMGALGLIGCQSTRPTHIPPLVEEFHPPPAGDERYLKPTSYGDTRTPLQPKKNSTANPNIGNLRPASQMGLGTPNGF